MSKSKVLLTLVVAALAGQVFAWLHTPIPWMMGPLLCVGLLSVLGQPTASAVPLRNLGQWVIGAALGLYFTPQVGALVAGLWWAIVAGVLWALALGWGFGAWLHRRHAAELGERHGGQTRPGLSTVLLASSIGAASEMTLMAERYGAKTDWVAASHTLRVMLVTVLIPFLVQLAHVQGVDGLALPSLTVHPQGLLLLAGTSLLGVWCMRRLGGTNPWFMGALLVSMALTLGGQTLSALPAGVVAAAQVVIGVSLGVRFTPQFVHTAPRWLRSVALGSLVMMLLSAGFAWVLARISGLHPVTMLLATSPGGIAEMAITAKALQLGVAMVTAFQVCRLVVVLIVTEPLLRWRLSRFQAPAPLA